MDVESWRIQSIDLALHQAGFVAEFDVPGAEHKDQATVVSSRRFDFKVSRQLSKQVKLSCQIATLVAVSS